MRSATAVITMSPPNSESLILTLSCQADAAMPDPRSIARREELSITLQRPYSMVLNETTKPGELPNRRGVIWFLASNMLQLSFEIDNTNLLGTIVKGAELRLDFLPEAPRADQTMYHFWRGRGHLAAMRPAMAAKELTQAFALCTNEVPSTKRTILIYATAACLIIGRFPTQPLLEHFGLSEQYSPIIMAIKKGDLTLFRTSMRRWRRWFGERGLYLLLKERLEVLVWRSLIRRLWLLVAPRTQDGAIDISFYSKPIDSTNRKPSPSLSIDAILAAIRWSSDDPSYTVIDVESIVYSLIDQKYILGLYDDRAQKISMPRPTVEGVYPAFPPVANAPLRESAETFDDDSHRFDNET
ncbi:hypothetical protein DL93DRAFT_549056 [Clavulina sp. PMI_390]|nr:hypothetical protein DL93DRAFT_549056 [Clavulina sp. PMI_390]